MNKIKELIFNNKRLREIFRFVVTGGISFIVDYGLFFVLSQVMHINYLISTGTSFTVSVVVNYFMCVLWVFEEAKDSGKKTMTLFILTSIIGLIINLILMWIFVDLLSINEMISKILATLLVMFWNYVSKKRVITN